MLSQDQILSYRENGYLLIRDALLPDQLATLQRLTNDFIEASRAVSESNDVYDLDEGHSVAQPRLTRIKLPHIQHPSFWEVATSERLTSYSASEASTSFTLKMLLTTFPVFAFISKLRTVRPSNSSSGRTSSVACPTTINCQPKL